jgi:30S ribosomal protein S31
MGKGDKRSRKGKIFKGSYGNSRPHKAKTSGAAATTAVAKPKSEKAAAPKKAAARKPKKTT